MTGGISTIPVLGILFIRFRREFGGNLHRLGAILGDGFPPVSLLTTWLIEC